MAWSDRDEGEFKTDCGETQASSTRSGETRRSDSDRPHIWTRLELDWLLCLSREATTHEKQIPERAAVPSPRRGERKGEGLLLLLVRLIRPLASNPFAS